MSYGQAELYTILNVSSVTSLLTKTSYIFYGTKIPELDATGAAISAQAKIINYYAEGPIDLGRDFVEGSYSINCRASIQSVAEAIRAAVLDVVNRSNSGSYYFVASVLPVLPPADATDVFNAPVSLIVKGR